MRISTVREFRDKATGLLRSKDPILVTRRGRLAGIFFPLQKSSLPVELKHELFAMLTTEIARQIKRRGIVLLASLLGGRARLVMNNPQIEELLTPQVTFAEVQEYAPVLARRKRLPEDILLLALASLPVTLIEPEAYQRSLSEAKRRIGGRDPDDVDILALAIQFQVPVWSNDKDFEASGIEWYTTEDLLRKLGILNEK